ncbi:MAG: RecX family transcriptional regulator [Candidatus Omnitrophica bacterium]|nr:RecX family transcriptional regulator [Candidatus Omnitrophota bacterium]MCF7877488.1 RecX family transcriptional regulator [Candidatus Omnitrophota bacterium]MCF7891544.1 RecX family transcriptional regulator [Candidatus Omnitrophota bacterium]MCF7897344.1 RecX family transcriptional regulator [Candidatus Omnitrophota bacterium]MCF7909686.1 RecX family transcriptional regulator [Candidatus Omnitrophota bacterium]
MKSFSKALSYAYLLLRYRPRSEYEIRLRLRKKEFSKAIIRKVVRSLKDYNYIDDQEFVKNYVESSVAKGWGPVKVEFNLKKFKVAARLRKKALEEIESQSDKLIEKLFKEKIYSLKKSKPDLDQKKLKEKAIRFLANKGFYYKDIFVYLNRIDRQADENR